MRPLAWLGALVALFVFLDRISDRWALYLSLSIDPAEDDDDDGGDDEPTPDGLRPFRDAMDGPV